MRVHHALGVARGAGGEEHGRHVLRRRAGDLGVEEAGIGAGKGPARLDQCVQRQQPRFVVLAQPARVIEPDVCQLRALRAQLEHLVDLLLVLDDGELHLGVVDREHILGRHGILVQRHRHRTERLRGQHGGVQARPVFADHHHVVAALHAALGHAAGQRPHQRGQGRPGQRLPDAIFLLAQCGCIGARFRVLEQQAGKGGLHRWSPGRCGPSLWASL